ncbi:InlB B-repeat-containing protein [Tannerella sp.]|uniref:InlB B-repeat-containing protein n=1 Tax=Tannerella sp. TaxID=2382127 RepID=UPI0026DB8E33|nr:InlB B-repeat-containing protein [Tannerella sp.]MDO4704501.1 InlB B-repeat-containing protein [Tannerella sp.]
MRVEICNYIYPMEPMAPQSYDISTRAAAVDEEFCGYASTRFGFESTKSASVNGVANNGTSAMPVKVILGDEIEYRINAVNAAPEFYGGGEFVATRTDNVQLRQGEYAPHELSTIVIEDVLPEGVELVGSPDNNGVFDANTRKIRWELMNVPRGGNRTVTFKVKLKVPLIAAYYQNVMENKATVTTKWVDMMLTRGEVEVATRNMDADGTNEYVSVTNSTFHQRAVCTVKFVVDPATGGALTDGNDQVIDYGTKPAAGVTVTPSDASYKFKGWKHGGFTSLKAGEAAVPAASGPAGDANWYTTVDVKGDVTFTAEMELQGWKIEYDFNDDKTTPGGKMPEVPNKPDLLNKYPSGYTLPAPPATNPSIEVKPSPERIGYFFSGWNTLDTDFSAGAPIILSSAGGDVKITAKWRVKRFGIGYELYGGMAPGTPNPTEYTIETLPIKVEHAPTRAGYTFVGWTNDRFAPTTQMAVDIPLKDANGVYTQDSLTFHAHWHKKLVVDTATCEAPLTLKGLPGAKGYKWEYIISATEKKEVGKAQTFDAGKSGTYVLTTDYGTVSVEDTFKVLFAFEGKQELKNNNNIPAKIGRKQEFYVKMDTTGRKVSYKWSLAEGDTTHSMKGDSLYVVFGTSGKKDVSVEIAVTLPSGLICKKELAASITISEKYNGFFVDQNVQGGREDGSSWANAYRRIEQALDKARAGDCVWVARGTYTPPKGKSYEMKYDSVEVYGGFGAWESYLHERVFASNQTILQRSNGGSSVIVIEGSQGMRWDGFIVEQGNATQGGGILNKNGQVTIANCIIRNNRADQGGGLYNGDGGHAVIFNTEISGNTANDGAGMYNRSAHPRLTNVTISGNLASGEGGGLYNDGSNPDVRNTILWDNRAGKYPNISNKSSMPTFSFSLIEKDRAGWDVALGADQGGNVDGSPVFRRRGFDEDGSMREGDYRLGAGSAAENQGYNRYVLFEKTRDAHLPTLGQSVYHKGIPYDLSGLSRIIDDRVDIGAYEYAPNIAFPKVSREIVIPTIKGLIFQPAPGIHYVNTGDDFTFTVKEEQTGNVLKAGEKKRLIERLKITTGDPIRDKDGIKMTENEDGSVTVKLIKVTSGIVLAVDPNTTSSAIISGEKVWSYEGHVLLSVKASTDVRIYDLNGQLVDTRRVNAGETAIPLPQGIYLVRIADRSYKVILR